MKANQKIMYRCLDKKINALKDIVNFDIPQQGWSELLEKPSYYNLYIILAHYYYNL